ncbi:MAG: malonate decarboxylase subunit alpha [Desulfobacterota bacterium]|nr:malonate decarboxylase subunit alpha [Thermodesulfobacteriota bacterium]
MNRCVQRIWTTLGDNTRERHRRVHERVRLDGKKVEEGDAVHLLEAVLEPGDRVCIEGDNQKHAQVLMRALLRVDPARIHDLHIVQSIVSLPENLDLFSRGIARRLDTCYAGAQGKRLAEMVKSGQVQLGSLHTFLELYARYFLDLTPRVALIAANAADINGNLYTGPNTEDTPTIVEATKFKQGIVIAQVNEMVGKVPRVDIPGDQVDYIIPSSEPFYQDPLFTRDPARISEKSILMAMMTIKGIYAHYGVTSLNHGIGYDTAAIELLLPTYGAELGLKGKICTHWVINPIPTIIPAIESGFVTSIYSFGSEPGMEAYVAQRPDVFFVGPDGSMRSHRAYCQLAGHYGVDLFIGSTLEIDQYGNSSTATEDRILGFGGAPNMGANAPGRRHATRAWLEVGRNCTLHNLINGPMPMGKRLIVQIVQSCRDPARPTFVEKLSAWRLAEQAGLPLPPVMIYGQDVTHIVTDIGIAYLYRCRDLNERRDCICAVAGASPLGSWVDADRIGELREKKLVQYPEDLGIHRQDATRDLLAARSIDDLVAWSGGLYRPPSRLPRQH